MTPNTNTLSQSERITLAEIESFERHYNEPCFYHSGCSQWILRDLESLRVRGLISLTQNKPQNGEKRSSWSASLTTMGRKVFEVQS